MCFSGQVRADYQKYAFSELASKAKTIRISGEPLSEDYEVGYGIFHAMVFCPAMVFKMYNFIDHLLSNETSRTIIQTIVHLIQSGVSTDAATLTSLKQFYPILASTLNLQYGNTLLAISTMAQLRTAKNNNWPFFINNTELVEKCLQGVNCDIVQDVSQNLGKSYCSSQPSLVHWLSSPIFPCSSSSVVPLW